MSHEYIRRNVFKEADKETKLHIFNFANDYMKFLNNAKTERDAVATIASMADEKGFVRVSSLGKIKPGDKIYIVNHDKAMVLIQVGEENVAENGFRIMGAHMDSPRLDLKPLPLYEDTDMALFKTHYYGGIKKYQWTAMPLALHGVVYTKDGKVNINIGEEEKDPVLYVSDLLPHLAQEQASKPINKAIQAESMNALVGSIPEDSEDEDKKRRVKNAILNLLYDKYGIEEIDFSSSELCLVPAGKARDCGLDRSMISAYGHDDKSSVYSEVRAFLESAESPHTLVLVLADKEEVGSDGITGMNNKFFEEILLSLCENLGKSAFCSKYNSLCISADVTTAYDPNYKDVYDKTNSCFLNGGVGVQKYTGARGKNNTNDAPADVVAKFREILDRENVIWQTGELGKVDAGGGGTIAKFISYTGVPTIDMGVPVISMHAPYEVISKGDLYEAYLAMKAFCK